MDSDKAAVEPVAWIVLWDADDEGMPGDVLLHRESGANNRAEEARAEGYTNVRVLPLYSGLYIEQLHTDHAAALQAIQAEASQIERENIEGWKQAAHWREKAEAAERRVAELEDVAEEARRAIGDHFAPDDCYATGPLTGDSFRDLVQCPACSFIALYDALAPAKKVD